MIPKDTIQQIKDTARIEDLIPEARKAGKDLQCKCPFCGKDGKGKGITISPSKQIAKCFSCGKGISGAIDWVMKVDKKEYKDALMILANQYNITITEEESDADRIKRLNHETKNRKKSVAKRNKEISFKDKQLFESGLTPEDIMCDELIDIGEYKRRPAFIMGTRDDYGEILPGSGDDMLIYYYNLDGKQVMYKPPRSKMYKPLIRVRWKNPAAHVDKFKRPIKYQSPAGSGSHLYIPQLIRNKYRARNRIETLYIQEGEKKTEKACKHGIDSVGIMGIQNLGSGNSLPPELHEIIEKCEVNNVVFLLDADWNSLSTKIKDGDQVDQRPRSFFYAVKNYKEYIGTLENSGLAVQIYFGYIKPHPNDDKGIDDLLTNTLQGREKKIKEDLQHALHAKDGNSEYIQLHKITMLSDKQLADYWNLNDHEAFAETHRTALKELKIFKFRASKYRWNEAGEIENAQPLKSYEKYWEEETKTRRDGSEYAILNFDYVNVFNFLQNRGFGRYRTKSGQFELVRNQNKVVTKCEPFEVRDFVTEFTQELKNKPVLNMLYRGGPQYLGPEKLSNLKWLNPKFERATRDTQCFYFMDKMWVITADGIKDHEYTQLTDCVWHDKIRPRKPSLLKEPMVKVTRLSADVINTLNDPELIEGEFMIELSEDAKNCDFLKFFLNTSNFTWKKARNNEEITVEEHLENTRHFINKMTAIGYLLHDYKNDSELKAVVAMDGKLSEVGASNGRSGKSLFGVAIEYIIPQVYIAAKSKDLVRDPFIFGDVTEKTRNVFLDDVRANVDFEFFFPLITGKLRVNPKGGAPFTLDKDESPKLLITTNHAINGEGSSYTDRQAFVAFSDYYNDTHKPIHDFKRNFFKEWPTEQWDLFYNFMACCVQVYFQSMQNEWQGKNMGVVAPPMEGLEQRRLRQQIGEDFMQWGDEYFSWDKAQDELKVGHLNNRIERKELFNDLLDKHPLMRKYTTANSFLKKIKFYCRYKQLHFNPTTPNKDGVEFKVWLRENPSKTFFGEADKSGGVEYITIANEDWIDI